jgi:rubrerythrin
MTPNQNTGCNAGLITAVFVLVAVGGVVSFLVSGGEGDFLPGLLIPIILIFVVVPIVSRAVKNAKKTAQGGGSTTASRPASSPSSTGSNRPYRYSLDTGERISASDRATEQAPVMNEEQHRQAVSEIMARRKREAKSGGAPVKSRGEKAAHVEPTDEQAEAQRQQNRDQTKRKLDDIADSIRERNRQLQVSKADDLPPEYTLCVNCGNVTKMTGKKTRCPVCGSVIEAV